MRVRRFLAAACTATAATAALLLGGSTAHADPSWDAPPLAISAPSGSTGDNQPQYAPRDPIWD